VDGEPNGLVYESAMRLVESSIPKPDESEREAALIAAQTELQRFGISCVHDFDKWDCYETLARMEKDESLKLRVVKNIPFTNLTQAIETGIKSGQGSDLLSFGWLKLFADGALGPQTAAMLSPFTGSGSDGMLFIDEEMLIEIGQKALPAGLSLAVHAIGDRANREVLNGYTQLQKDGFLHIPSLKPRIEHVQLIHPDDIPRFAQNGVIASMQPIHAVSDRDMADRYWGSRCEYAYAWNSIINSGADLIFGSDAPVESPNPFWGLFSSVSRSSVGLDAPRPAWTPHQRIKLHDALKAYITRPPLYANPFVKAGKLQPGYSADLIVLQNDLFEIPEEQIASILPAATMVNGEWVYLSSFEIQ
jgi:predicted amidohydrolase YtcJ